MIPDILSKAADYTVNFLSIVGAVAEELLIVIPFILLVFLAFAIVNYKEELAFNRLSSSRIGDIDQLDQKRYYLFMKAFLGWMGFEEDDDPTSSVAVKEKKSNVSDEEADDDTESDNTAGDSVADGKKPMERVYDAFERDAVRKRRKVIVFGDPLILVKEGVRYSVVLEKKEHGVGLLAFNKLEKAIGMYNCQEGIIINCGSFSAEDIGEGKARNIELHDREWLIKTLLNLQGVEDTAGKDFSFYFQGFWRWALRGY